MLHWPSLSSRRTYFSLVECYKIVFGLLHLDFEGFFEFAKVKSTRANHSYKLDCKLSRINCFKYSFFNNVISHWNDLPSNVVEAGSLELFKCKLKSLSGGLDFASPSMLRFRNPENFVAGNLSVSSILGSSSKGLPKGCGNVSLCFTRH